MKDLMKNIVGFDWDDGNIKKNQIKHGVSIIECEEIFFNKSLLVFLDKKHSKVEARIYVLGKTNLNRRLFIVFVIRNNKIRVISARSMSRKERKIYERN